MGTCASVQRSRETSAFLESSNTSCVSSNIPTGSTHSGSHSPDTIGERSTTLRIAQDMQTQKKTKKQKKKKTKKDTSNSPLSQHPNDLAPADAFPSEEVENSFDEIQQEGPLPTPGMPMFPPSSHHQHGSAAPPTSHMLESTTSNHIHSVSLRSSQPSVSRASDPALAGQSIVSWSPSTIQDQSTRICAMRKNELESVLM